MAFAARNWYASYTFRDNNANTADVTFRLPADRTHAQVETTAAAIRDALVPLVDARLVSYDVSQELINDDATAIPSSAEVERKLAITFADAENYAKGSYEIPSPVFSIEQFGTDAVNPANTLVAALIAAVTNGGLGAGNGAVAFGGNDFTQVFGTPKIVHRRRKGGK